MHANATIMFKDYRSSPNSNDEFTVWIITKQFQQLTSKVKIPTTEILIRQKPQVHKNAYPAANPDTRTLIG